MSNLKTVLQALASKEKTILEGIVNGVEKAGLHLEGAVKDKTPVKEGNLQGSIVTGEVEVSNGKVTVEVGTNMEYAAHVEYGVTAPTPTGKARKKPYEYNIEGTIYKGTGAGMFRRSLDEEQENISKIIKNGG